MSCRTINIDGMLNNFFNTETIENAIQKPQEKPVEHDEDKPEEKPAPEPEVAVEEEKPIIYHDDKPITLPGSLKTDYYRPQNEKFESVQKYWEEQILFLKWNEKDIKPLFAIDTEKPVYKPGEIVRATILFYDRYTRKPISLKEAQLTSPTLTLLDANRKSLTKLELAPHIDQATSKGSFPSFKIDNSQISSVVEFKLADDFAGGFYTWEFTSENLKYKERTNFFVSAYQNVKEAVILDFNKDTLLPGDDVMAKVTLKLLGNESIGGDSGQLEFTYRVVDDTGNELESNTKKMTDRMGYIVYQTPDELGEVRSLDILVNLEYNGKTLTAVKKLMITDIESVRVDFMPGGGKYSIHMENEVYFQAYADVDRTVPIEVENGTVIKLCYAVTEPDINEDETKPNPEPEPEPVNPEEPVVFENPQNADATEANEGRVLESEPLHAKGSFLDKFLDYFISMVDDFLNLNPQKIDDGGIRVPEGENENNGDDDDKETSGVWETEEMPKHKQGKIISKTNNYSKLPQNRYSTSKIVEAGVEVQTMIRSNEDGKGSFKILIEPECSYYLSVTKSLFYNHFFIINTSKTYYAIDHSDMRLTLDKKVLHADDSLQVTVSKLKSTLATKFRLLVQNNGNILQEEIVEFGECTTENETEICNGAKTLKVADFSKHDGGVFTVQVYRDGIFDYPEQESLVYVYPKNVLKIEKTYDKETYTPGDSVEIDLKIDNASDKDEYFYRVIVSDESAFLQLEKRNLPPTLLTKVFLEKELRGVDGVVPASHAYLNWIFEDNESLLKEEYLMGEIAEGSGVKSKLLETSTQKLEKLIGNQKWRQLFHTGREMSNFLMQIGYNYTFYNDARDYFELDYWVGCSRHLIFDKKFQGKLEALLPFSSDDIITNSNYKYGGAFARPMDDEIMFDAMPEAAEFDERDMKGGVVTTAADGGEDSTNSPPAPAPETETEPQDSGDASTEANNDIELESDMIKENTIFFTALGWKSSEKLSFTLPADVSKFRVTVLAISKDGRYGLNTDFVSSQKNFDVTIDHPAYVFASETIDLNVNVFNNTPESITVTNDYNSDSWDVSANTLKRSVFKIKASDLPKIFKFSPSKGDPVSVDVSPEIKHGLNFKHSRTFMLRQADATAQVMPDPILLPESKEPGSVLVNVKYTPMGAPVILSGYEQLIREPFGCFEQTSSTTFPMVILMQYLNLQKNPEDQDKLDEMKFKITTNLKKGVKKLLSFETPTGGFEWFGKSPGHVTLTAYGLWQFLEMNQIGNYVDVDVIDRTLNWLRGKFSSANVEFPLSQGLDSFGSPPQQISDIYIVFVMSMFDQYEIDYSSVVDPVISKFESGSSTSDSYLLSFVGLLYENLGKKDKANALTSTLIANQDSSTGEFTSVDATITLSRGKSKAVEATAMALLFLIRNDSGKHMDNVEKGVEFLMKNMSFGYFYSTQATVLALKALVTYSKYMTSIKAGTKSFDVAIDGVTKKYEVEVSENPDKEYPPVIFEEFKDTEKSSLLFNITPNFSLEKNSKYVFSVDYEYGTDAPLSVANSPLTVDILQNSLAEAESFSLKVSNQSEEKQGMVNMIFYKPSHLKVNLNDLETLRKTGKIDYYELLKNNSEIVFYWRGIGPKSSYEVDLTLVKEYEVSDGFAAQVGAYLYYDKDGSIVFAK